MPISLGNNGTGRPYIRFSPQANAWLKAGEGGAVEFDPRTSGMLIDVARAQLGWLTLKEGSREWSPWPSMTSPSKRPDADAKTGFMVSVYAPKLLGDEVHDFSANATASTRFFETLYNQVEAAGELATGRVPLVQVTGSKLLKIGKGTTREVEFTITKYVDRPKALAEIQADAVEEPKKAEPPKSEPAKQPASADEEF
ncbi:hypothetical protein [Labrys neptuniae]